MLAIFVLAAVFLQTSANAKPDSAEDLASSYFRILLGTKNQSLPLQPYADPTTPPSAHIPEKFDARTHWPNCTDVLSYVRDDGSCSNWASAPLAMLSQRLCIETQGATKFTYSVQDTLECADEEARRCAFGDAKIVFHYWINRGIVSGGNAGSNIGCKPYPNESMAGKDPERCNRNCTNPLYHIPYDKDRKFGKRFYHIENHVQAIKSEIFFMGPVAARFTAMADFMGHDFNKVYVHDDDTPGFNPWGMVNVIIIGWGEERGIPYWLCMYTQGESWGPMKGYFKVLQGKNQLGIEEDVFGAESLIVVNKTKKEVKSDSFRVEGFLLLIFLITSADILICAM